MEHRGYSQARFFLKVDSNNFDIKFFVTRDYRLSKDYQIKVKINTKSILNSGDLIGKESILTIKGKENDTEICGILTQFQGPLSTRGGYDYFLIISSPLTKLKFQKNNKIYLKKTILDLIKEILDKNGYKKYWILTLNEYPLQDAFIQRNQSASGGLFTFIFKNLLPKRSVVSSTTLVIFAFTITFTMIFISYK